MYFKSLVTCLHFIFIIYCCFLMFFFFWFVRHHESDFFVHTWLHHYSCRAYGLDNHQSALSCHGVAWFVFISSFRCFFCCCCFGLSVTYLICVLSFLREPPCSSNLAPQSRKKDLWMSCTMPNQNLWFVWGAKCQSRHSVFGHRQEVKVRHDTRKELQNKVGNDKLKSKTRKN